MKIKVYKNIDQERIIVARDKAELQLMDYQEILKSRYSWMTPLGWIFSFGTAMAGVDRFRDVLFVPAAICEAAISIGLVYSTCWLVVSLARVYKNRKKGGIDELLDRLGGKSPNPKARRGSEVAKRPAGILFETKRRIKGLFERW